VSDERVVIHQRSFVHASLSERAASEHALPLHKLVIPVAGASLVCTHEGHTFRSREPVLVAANVAQSMCADGPSVAVFVPATLARIGMQLAGPPIARLDGAHAARFARMAELFLTAASVESAAELLDALTRRLLTPTRLDRRVVSTLAVLDESAVHTRPKLDALAAPRGLSASRLSHLFAESGLSLRAWISYLRAFHAAQALLRGDAPSAVASSFGYADQPHLTRELRRQFGRTPRTMRSAVLQGA
jgi:AraC-like DNA-binding protein